MKFKDLIIEKEETPKHIQDFINQMDKDFKKHFPNGFFHAKYSTNLTDSISGSFGMIGNIKDNVSGYHDNDKMRHSFIMFPNDPEKTVWSFKTSIGNVMTEPEEGSYMVMGSVRTKMGNNSKITLDKANIKMVKFFKKLSGIMKDNVDKIHGVDKIDKKYLVFK